MERDSGERMKGRGEVTISLETEYRFEEKGRSHCLRHRGRVPEFTEAIWVCRMAPVCSAAACSGRLQLSALLPREGCLEERNMMRGYRR